MVGYGQLERNTEDGMSWGHSKSCFAIYSVRLCSWASAATFFSVCWMNFCWFTSEVQPVGEIMGDEASRRQWQLRRSKAQRPDHEKKISKYGALVYTIMPFIIQT
jgi:hypothetical protein